MGSARDRREDSPSITSHSPVGVREILSASDVSRTISRMAHQVIEKTALDAPDSPRVVLIGIPTRGTILAQRLADKIEDFSDVRVGIGSLDITLYRDDLRSQPHRPVGRTTMPDRGVDGALVILVDDVLYSGRSVRAALDALRDMGRPQAVQLAVLVDRGHRELPIRADYVGKNIPTARTESVWVRMEQHDGRDAVDIGPADGSDETSDAPADRPLSTSDAAADRPGNTLDAAADQPGNGAEGDR